LAQLLIDGDLLLFKATAAAEFESNPEGDLWFLSTNLAKARDMWDSQIDAIQRALDSDDLVIVVSGERDFRRELEPTYKGNRKGKRKPLGYIVVREWLYERHPDRVVSQETLEADDYLGILATTPNAPKRIIVSEDKDLKTIPGALYRLGTLQEIGVDEAEYNWLFQTLMGDPADGYKGCPGIGEVKAKAILGKPGSRWENVRQAFLKAGLTDDDAVLQARLARILRHSDWDSENKQPRLWCPGNQG
jgi:DNA polymerase-1